jgi:hypothetical protein
MGEVMPSYAIFYFYVRRADFHRLYPTGKAERQGDAAQPSPGRRLTVSAAFVAPSGRQGRVTSGYRGKADMRSTFGLYSALFT